MVSFSEYFVYDFRRDRNSYEFDAASDEDAAIEFGDWYNRVVRPDRWEGRALGRYWLFCRSRSASGDLQEPRAVSVDENVRLSREWFRMCDPPVDEASEVEREAEFRRLDGLDVARLASRPSNVFAEHLDDGKRR